MSDEQRKQLLDWGKFVTTLLVMCSGWIWYAAKSEALIGERIDRLTTDRDDHEARLRIAERTAGDMPWIKEQLMQVNQKLDNLTRTPKHD